MENLSVEQRHRVLNLIDRELLATKCITNIAPLTETRASVEKQKLMEVLEMTSHNISKASALLGVSRPTIYYFIKKYGISSTDIKHSL